jgi:hypothetical protein
VTFGAVTASVEIATWTNAPPVALAEIAETETDGIDALAVASRPAKVLNGNSPNA